MRYRLVFVLCSILLFFVYWQIGQKVEVHHVGTRIFRDQCLLCHRLERSEPDINPLAKMILDTSTLSDQVVWVCIEERSHGLTLPQKKTLFRYLRSMEVKQPTLSLRIS